MSEPVVGGADDKVKDQVVGDNEKTKQDEKVAYETYKRTVDEAKKAKSKVDELAQKLKGYEEKELEAQGKSQELIESLRSQIKEKDEKINKVVGSFAFRSVESQLKAEALKHGCVDVDLLLKASSSEFSSIEVDAENGFAVNQDDLKRFFEMTIAKHPALFKKAASKFHDAAPVVNGDTKKDYSKMNTAELLIEYKNLSI
jgi:hypothetical protein